jgi:hypothetical protein
VNLNVFFCQNNWQTPSLEQLLICEMKTIINFLKSDKGLLLIIVLIGTLLRFYDAFNIPFTHDELSAYYRLQFDTFGELIEKGVKVDGHPALVQVFLFYWIKLLGHDELIVKLPFLLLGVGSIPLSYIVTKKWFNSSTALIVALFMATLQFPIMFSQIARPYISGLFFSLLLVKYWTEFLFEKKNNLLSFIGMVISATLCSYNHYFSLMFAGIVGITGLFFLNKTNAKVYVLSLVSVILLFLPHLNIFLFQFSGKGLNWLGAPGSSFIIEHIKFIFHFNWWVYLSVLIGLAFGIYQQKSIKLSKFQIVSLSWFLLPIIIGVTYSIFVKPVIQYSMLIFSFPFLLIFLFSFLKPLNVKWKSLAILLIIIINISTLIFGREHYKVFFNQPIERFSEIISNANLVLNMGNSAQNPNILLNENPKYVNYYFEKLNPNLSYQSIYYKELNPVVFNSQVRSINSNYLLLGNVPKNLVLVAKQHYPYVFYLEDGVNYTFLILSKNPDDNIKQRKEFHHSEPGVFTESIHLNATQEYSPAIEFDLTDVLDSRSSEIEISVAFNTESMNNGLIVCSITKNEEVLLWRAISVDEYTDPALFGKYQNGFLALSLKNAFKHNKDIEGAKLKVLYWNKTKQNISLKDLEVKIKEGNKYEYATIEAIQ